MVNATDLRSKNTFSSFSVPVLAFLVLTGAAWLRSAEYDEQYTLFLTAGVPRPDWPETVFPAGIVAAAQAGHASLDAIARDLRATDVHPPLYFWAVSIWRRIVGPSLFAARMLSVLCGVLTIALVGAVARRCAIRPAIAMLITLGCYGFVYTNAIARGFAPAQTLTLCGIALLLGRRQWLVGLCLGAACCCNYLAAFVAVAAILSVGAWRAVPAMVPFLALDAWFFVAQHDARPGQFPPFEVWPSLLRLVEYQTASVFGGLPMYLDGAWRIVAGACIGLVAVVVIVGIAGAHFWNAGPAIRVFGAAAIATPIGLLLLGAAFNNTPIELRYLSFGLPFVALLAASAVPRGHGRGCRGSLRRRSWVDWRILVLIIQFGSIIGLLISPRTMQPARIAATEAARLVGNGVVLLPRGNDGVGIVGAFAIEAPAWLPILLIRPGDPVAERVAPYRRVVLALLAQDRDSVASIAGLRAAFALLNWRRVGVGSSVEVYERTGDGR